MTTPRVLYEGLRFGESPRWHDGRLWFANWVANEICVLDPSGAVEVVATFRGFPLSLDWLPDGRLLVVSGREGQLARREGHAWVTHCELGGLLDQGVWNELVVDGSGAAYVNGSVFRAPVGERASGVIARVSVDGSPEIVADGLQFPNGMAITPDGDTLIVAESHGQRLTAYSIGSEGELGDRRVWANLGDGAPDGICLDEDGACWYADVPHRRCVRVREGGEVLQTVELDRGAFACALGGVDGMTLYITAAVWPGMDEMLDAPATGQIVAGRAPARRAGRP